MADPNDGLNTPWVEEIIASLEEPAMLLNANGRVAVLNAAARTAFGDWVAGQSYVSVLRQPGLLRPVEDAFFDRHDGFCRFVHSAGQQDTTFDVQVTPLSSGPKASRGPVLLVFRDRTDAQTTAAARRDFIANVSHELKTPLTAVIGFVETLQGPARSDEGARDRFLHLMGMELGRMKRLVSDLLSLSRVEAQLRQRPRDSVDLVRLIQEAVELLSTSAEAVGAEIAIDLPSAAVIPGDRDQIMQLLVNLIENALKYGAAGGIVEIGLTYLDKDISLRCAAWRLTVADRGEGVAPQHIPRLTERFYRVDGARAQSEGGTGLGLAIVKHIANRHRGRMRIESEIGRGTTVSVTLPAE